MAKIYRQIQVPIVRNAVSPSQNNPTVSTQVNRKIDLSNGSDQSKFAIDFIITYDDDPSENMKDNEGNDRSKINPNEKQKQRESFQNFLKNKHGLRLQKLEPLSNRTVFVLIQTPFDALLLTAESIRMKLPIAKIIDPKRSPSNKVSSCWHKCKDKILKPFRLDSSLIEEHDVDYYTAVYSARVKDFEQHFDTLRGSRDEYFTPSDRALLTYELLSRADCDDHPDEKMRTPRPQFNNYAEGKGIHRLKNNGSYKSYFPLHEPLREGYKRMDPKILNTRERLRKYWATFRMFYKYQPLDLVRSYMGEQVAFYFALLGCYTQMLIPAALVGLIVFIYGAASASSDATGSDICGTLGETTYMCPVCDRICPFEKLSKSCAYSQISAVFDNLMTVVYAALMSLWGRWFIEMWKRQEIELQYEWDSIDFAEENEPIRPAYEQKAQGHTLENPITEIKEPYVEVKKHSYMISFIVVTIMIAIACTNVFATIVYRAQVTYMLNQTTVKAYASLIVSITSAVINLIVSLVLSKVYYFVARKLTEAECHKYQSRHDESFTTKIYLFEFVNYYSSIFYIAFLKGRFRNYPSSYGEAGVQNFNEQCDATGCLVELTIQFFITMTGKSAFKLCVQLLAVLLPKIKHEWEKRYKNVQSPKNQWEIDNELEDFDSNTLLPEYLNIILQFGFVTLFATAFPLAPLFALINNSIELRLDAWKFLTGYKRPIPFKAAGIGTWNNILSGLSYFALLTNAVILAWTSEFIPKMAYRVTQTDGRSLVGFVNWTLSSFPIADYNLTNTLGYNVPSNVTYCRYRDFRDSIGPNYSPTIVYWNILVARLAFVLLFEHAIFFILYLIRWFIPDVPKEIQDKIKREHFLGQKARWSSENTQNQLKSAAQTNKTSNNINPTVYSNSDETSVQRRTRKK